MLVLGRWRRPANPESWNVQEREAARLLGRNDCAGAAIALLPVGALLRIESLNPLHDWAEVTLPNSGPSAEATAQSSAAAIIAALFRALAEKYEVPPGKATTP
ncbi:hypothetical protein ACLIMP_06340 [Novosphingobium aerophilum]|uniref:hypothetical protein n=1 Tax=Novosphingobium TaxID=165696 RepID=UPI002D7A2203|nr:hypothetical protein [Novosphingobium sp. RL4]WRT93841.1 hypothetical protein U9J33_04820 [Novosphingobium sp. RL4]